MEPVSVQSVAMAGCLSMNELPIMMTVKQVAKWLQYSPRTIRELCQRDLIPHKKIGKEYRFNSARLSKWAEKGGEG